MTPHTSTLTVETPEHVTLTFELAGVGSRTAAAIYDMLIVAALVAISITLAVAVASRMDEGGALITALLILVIFAVQWGYFALFEAFRSGRTPGKRRMGLRVVMDTGHPVTVSAAVVRNLVRVVDLQPFALSLVGLGAIIINPRKKRLGDIVAGTIVVKDLPPDLSFGGDDAVPAALEGGEPVLSDEEFALLDRFRSRVADLEPALRARFAADLAARFADRDPLPERSPDAFLRRLHEDERRRRVATPGPSRSGGRTAATAAERFVARRRPVWDAFRTRAAHLEEKGLASLTGAEVVAFAASYREIAADTARARTYGADARVLDWLGQAMSSGHNALYGSTRLQTPALPRVLFETLPGAVWAGRRFVLLAFALFAIPAAAGYTMLRAQPEQAWEILPSVILGRAEEGVRQEAEGTGYAQTPDVFLPVVATSIIANNVQVSIMGFAFGITAGVGTVFLLVFNGLFLGAIIGYYETRGLADWILTFIAGHGPLELTAIFISGGAGLVLAAAILAPGDLSRRDALVLRGRLAVRMFGASVLLLLLAGAIEGMLSASDAAPVFKVGVGLASCVLMLLLGVAGRRAATPSPGGTA